MGIVGNLHVPISERTNAKQESEEGKQVESPPRRAIFIY